MNGHIEPIEVSLFRGELRSRELPSSVNLGEINAVMNRLWKKSIRHIARGEVREYGGTLVLDKKGELKIINVTEGSVDRVILKHEVGEGETYVGTFHTHPYETGQAGIAFSGADLADAINNSNIITLVQSGEWVFAAIRTEKTPSQVDWLELDRELDEAYEGYLNEGMFPQEAAFLANLDTCANYRLAFYYGEIFQELEEVYRP